MSDNKTQTPYGNPMATLQVIGALASNPFLLCDDKYRFTTNDFPNDFHKYVFRAIVGIATSSGNGQIDIDRIDPIEIEQWLKNYPEWFQVFVANDGANWVKKAIKAFDPGKLHYYYNLLKKYSLLNEMARKGIDTTPILDPNLIDPVEMMKRQARFDEMTIKDIIATVETTLIDLKDKYESSDERYEAQAGEDIMEMVDSLQKSPDIGASFTSPYLSTIFYGARLGSVFIETSPSGYGKSRRQAGESAHFAVPMIYDLKKKEWVETGYNLPTLLISTELTLAETQRMWLAYLSGVEEARIKINDLTPDERERVVTAAKLIQSAPLYFVSVTDYDVNDIENIIRKFALTKHVEYFYFDYIGSTSKVLSSVTHDSHVRDMKEYQVLFLFAERLKNKVAKTYNVFIYSATQISGEWKDVKEADEQLIRGSKAIVDKVDAGWVLLPVRERDRPIVDQYKAKGFVLEPNYVMHCHKNRGGNGMKDVRIYGYFDLGTCRWTDCFVTKYSGEMIDLQPITVVWDKGEEDKPVDENEKNTGEPQGLLENNVSVESEKPTIFGLDMGDKAEVYDPTMPVEDELPFDFTETNTRKAAGWGSSTETTPRALLEPTVAEEEFPVSQEAEEEQAPAQKEKPTKPTWGTGTGDDSGGGTPPYGWYDF